MTKRLLMIGTFDSKAEEFSFLRDQLLSHGCDVAAFDVGIMQTACPFPIDIPASQVASAADDSLEALRAAADRGAAMKCMSRGAARLVAQLHSAGRFDGIIGMGGSGGTSVVTAAMRALPLGVPKVCLSTVASSDTSPYVGSKDIILIPSITDVSGLNRISKNVISQAAAAICGMVNASPPTIDDDRPIIVASMFGNTTDCVHACREHLDAAGYEVLVFHAVGAGGGKTLETLVDDGLVDACLDITTTEWADEICNGIFSAGQDRLSAPGRQGIPHLVAPGCIDMVNFGPVQTVPQEYRDAGRLFYEWNPEVTLMRTNVEENKQLGRIFAEKANAACGPVAFILPLRGVSILDGDGDRFCDREADQAMFSELKATLRQDVPVIEVDANINDPEFARAAVDTMLDLINSTKA